MKNTFALPCFLFLCLLVPALSAQETASPKAKNVILMIGDGMGFTTQIAGSYWRFGEMGKQPVDSFPHLLGMSTFERNTQGEFDPNVKGYDPEVFWKDLMGGRAGTKTTDTTDSAAAATAIYSGVKTLGGRMGTDFEGKPVKLLSEYAADSGRSSGSISTVVTPHATPGAMGSHNKSRSNYAEIFNEMLDTSPLSVMMGAGHPMYDQGNPIDFSKTDKDGKPVVPGYSFVGGEETWNRLTHLGPESGILFFDTREMFQKMSSPGPDVPAKVVGVFRSRGSLPPFDGAPDDPAAQKAVKERFANVNTAELPTLSEMSAAALGLLGRDKNGFILMIEGGAIDTANHGRDIARSVLEHTGFMKAVETVVNWVEKNSSWDETLLIVTADHETGQLWGPGTYEDSNGNGIYNDGEKFNGFQPIQNNGLGKVPTVQYAYGSHTNALVPFWAKGAGAKSFEKRIRGVDERAARQYEVCKTPANAFRGQYIDNTDIVPVVVELWKP